MANDRNTADGGRAQRDAALQVIAQHIATALGAVRLWSLSLHDERGDVLWTSENSLGPEEHAAVSAALELGGNDMSSTARRDSNLGDGRVAITLPIRPSTDAVLGVVMMVVDAKTVNSGSSLLTERLRVMEPHIRAFADWLAADISATQTHLRALVEVPADFELELEATGARIGAVRPRPKSSQHQFPGAATAPATPAASVASAPAAAVKPAPPPASPRERHISELTALPIILYVQQLQPLAEGRRTERFEVLLRTDSEQGHQEAPLSVLQKAADGGVGSLLDRRIVTDLLAWLVANEGAWRTNRKAFTVNLSISTLTDRYFLHFLDRSLLKAALPRGMIGFELDAKQWAQQPDRVEEFCKVLAALGCNVILDDFSLSTKHAALLGLKGLSMVKLNPSLTKSIRTDKRTQAVAAGIAQMTRLLGVHSCVKSVEGGDNQKLLSALRIDFAQSFDFSAPKPIETLA
jgi:EAL domain-containing protein (putative c-di-GMP-specific phosphodiesterase class I)